MVSKVLPTAAEQTGTNMCFLVQTPTKSWKARPANLSSRNSGKLCDVLGKRGPKTKKPAVHPERHLRPFSMLATRAQARRSLFLSKTNPMQNSHNGIIATRSSKNTTIARRTNRYMPY